MFNQNRVKIERMQCTLDLILKNQGVLMSQVDQVVSAVTQLGTDISKEISDAEAALAAAIAAEGDPTQVAKLTAVLAQLQASDTAVTGFDASLAGTSTATGTSTGS